MWPLKGVTLGELAYAEATASVSIAATTEVGATVIVTAPPIVCDGATAILVEFQAYSLINPSANNTVLYLFQDGVSIGRWDYQPLLAGGTPGAAVRTARRLTPSAGTHTYSVRGSVSGGTATLAAGPGGASTDTPAFIRITTASPISNAPAGALLPVQYGTSLPTSPVDGQEAILVDSLTNPTYQWRFRYNANSTSPYKWEFVGGPSVLARVDVSENTASNTPVDLATPGPTFTAPRDGEYLIHYSAQGTNSTVNSNVLALFINGSNPADTGQSQLAIFVPVAGTYFVSGQLTKFAITGTRVIQLKYQANAGTATFLRRVLQVTPVRVS